MNKLEIQKIAISPDRRSKIQMFRYSNNYRASSGFTLIEMIVSLAIFSVVSVVALVALMKIISANKKAQSLQAAMSNISYVLESMSREMKVGGRFDCASSQSLDYGDNSPNNCDTGNIQNLTITFDTQRASDGLCPYYAYFFDVATAAGPWTISKVTQSLPAGPCPTGNSGTFDYNLVYPVIDPNVIITGYRVKITKEPMNPGGDKPMMTLMISGYVGSKEVERTYFDVQTSVGGGQSNK